jgi:hypothetical protein
MVPALVGWYIGWYFCTEGFVRNSFSIFWKLFFLNLRDTLFPSKGGLSAPNGVQSPPFWMEKGAPAKITIPKCTNQDFLWYWYGKYWENTNQYQPKIPNQ